MSGFEKPVLKKGEEKKHYIKTFSYISKLKLYKKTGNCSVTGLFILFCSSSRERLKKWKR